MDNTTITTITTINNSNAIIKIHSTNTLTFLYCLPVFLGIFILISNGLLIYLILTRRHLWKRDHIRLINMCIAALFLSIFYYIPHHWISKNTTTFLYHLQYPIRDFLIASFNYHLTIDALEKTIIIAYPISHDRIIKTSRAFTSVAIVWLACLIIGFCPIFTFRKFSINNTSAIYSDLGIIRCNYVFYVAFYTFCFIIPIVIIFCCNIYLCIVSLRHLRKIQRLAKAANKERGRRHKIRLAIKQFRAVRVVILTTGTFMMLTFPYYICILIGFSLHTSRNPATILEQILLSKQSAYFAFTTKAVLQEIAFAFPAINPIILVQFTHDIRIAMSNFLHFTSRSRRLPINKT
ncbi:rhodopsin [Trichoplax sp. H2]|nr:rhodopsin [Trichoplax sp. H2]|eukprot:RDD40459.1 rhodopsin [Trichoplax sp. H2]